MSTERTSPLDADAIRTAVRERYTQAALRGASCCGPATVAGREETAGAASCCADVPVRFTDGRPIPDDIAAGSLGCGAPIDAAALQPGETVVDLGSGGGLDVFLAIDRVGPSGRAIGVDMTPEMIQRARANAARIGAANVEFRLGEIEHLPIVDGAADVVISNCVINLLPDKRRPFAEAYRVLKPGGRLVVSDIVSTGPQATELATVERWTACLAGAIPEVEYLAAIADAGFADVRIVSRNGYIESVLHSATVRAVKPK